MTRRWMLGALLALAAGVPAQAAGTVALLPTTIGKGAPENTRVVSESLQSALRDKGFRLVAPSRVQSAMRGVNTNAPIPIATLARIRKATGADYLVYPRVLNVGVGINDTQFRAVVIVNVVGSNASSFFHTRQVGQEFQSRAGAAGRAVIDRGSADQAVDQLLEGFFAKAR